MTWGSRGAALAVGMLTVCALVSGCAATGRGVRRQATPRDPGPFPTRAALASLEQPPPAEKLPELDIPLVEQWELAGPFPERIGLVPAEYRGGFGAQLVSYARERGPKLAVSADMACFARESGRFILARGSMPPSGLQRHMAGRCGSPGVRHDVLSLTGEVPPGVTEEQLAAHMKDRFAELLKKVPSGPGQTAAGVWFGRSGKKAVVAVATEHLDVDLDPISFAPGPDGAVVLSGTLARPANRLEALITRGQLDFAVCRADPEVKLPRFSLRCPANRADASAWVDLFVFAPEQVLGSLGVDLLVFPQGKGTTTYARPVLRPGSGAPEEDAARFAYLLNGLRAELGLKPVVVSAGESRLAQKIAPNYFASVYGKAPQHVADMVALGMMAGWEVDQVTRAAYFSDWVSTGDVSVLLAEMLDSPGARRTLFEPSVRSLAFGSYRMASHDVLAAMVATYAPFEEQPPLAEAQQVIAALNKARAQRGLGPADMVPLPEDVRAEMDEGLAAGVAMDDIINPVLQRVSQITRRGVRGGVLETGSLEAIRFPEELLTRPNLAVFVAVTHYKPRGSPWGVYVVGLAFSMESVQTAALEAPVTSSSLAL